MNHPHIVEKKLHPTGLRKVCPRCKRVGIIFISPDNTPSFTIHWEGSPRGNHGGTYDQDINLGWQDLINPQSGCGYDYAVKKKEEKQCD